MIELLRCDASTINRHYGPHRPMAAMATLHTIFSTAFFSIRAIPAACR